MQMSSKVKEKDHLSVAFFAVFYPEMLELRRLCDNDNIIAK